jgi:hypothetical protein
MSDTLLTQALSGDPATQACPQCNEPRFRHAIGPGIVYLVCADGRRCPLPSAEEIVMERARVRVQR